MKTVWKFPFEVKEDVAIPMPEGADVLTVQAQWALSANDRYDGQELCIWALVDPDAPVRVRCFRVAGTGRPIDPDTLGRYIGTFQLLDGKFIGHLWEKAPAVVKDER